VNERRTESQRPDDLGRFPMAATMSYSRGATLRLLMMDCNRATKEVTCGPLLEAAPNVEALNILSIAG